MAPNRRRVRQLPRWNGRVAGQSQRQETIGHPSLEPLSRRGRIRSSSDCRDAQGSGHR